MGTATNQSSSAGGLTPRTMRKQINDESKEMGLALDTKDPKSKHKLDGIVEDIDKEDDEQREFAFDSSKEFGKVPMTAKSKSITQNIPLLQSNEERLIQDTLTPRDGHNQKKLVPEANNVMDRTNSASVHDYLSSIPQEKMNDNSRVDSIANEYEALFGTK